MPRLAANLGFLFCELDFMERFGAAAAAGFKGVEFPFPYGHPKDALVEALRGHGLVQVLHNLPPGDWSKGERGIATHPGREGEFQDGVGTAIEYACALGCRQLNCLAGIAPSGARVEDVERTFVENLRFAARATDEAGIKLLIEPINTFDIPGFYLHGSAQALELIVKAAVENIYLQYDVYHMQRMEGELAATLERHLPRIAHIQIADNPGRHEPGTGEINYRFLLALLDRLGYPGWVGCEYHPRDTTSAGLGWRAALGVRSA